MTLKEYMTTKKLTVTQIADALGTSKGYVSDLVAGKRTCSLDMAVKIEEFTRNRVKCRDLLEAARCM